MNKNILTIFLIVIVLSHTAVFASEVPKGIAHNGCVFEEVGVLSEQNIKGIDEHVEKIVSDIKYDIAFLLIDKPVDDIDEEAKKAYKRLDIGYGDNKDGIILLINFDDQRFTSYNQNSVPLVKFFRHDLDEIEESFLKSITSDKEVEVALKEGMLAYADTVEAKIKGTYVSETKKYDKNISVHDDVNVLAGGQLEKLESAAKKFEKDHNTALNIVVIDKLYDGLDEKATALKIYRSNDFGYGEDNDGLMLLVATVDRKYRIVTKGSARNAFINKNLEKLEKDFLPALSDGDYFNSFLTFVSTSDEVYLDYEKDPESYKEKAVKEQKEQKKERQSGKKKRSKASKALVEITLFVVALISGLGFSFYHKRKLNTARREYAAGDYVVGDSFKLTREVDKYLYSTITKTEIRREKDNSSGGGYSSGSSWSSSSSDDYGGSGGSF